MNKLSNFLKTKRNHVDRRLWITNIYLPVEIINSNKLLLSIPLIVINNITVLRLENVSFSFIE